MTPIADYTVSSYEPNADIFTIQYKGEPLLCTVDAELRVVQRVLGPNDYNGDHHGYELLCLPDDDTNAIVDACVAYYDALGFE